MSFLVDAANCLCSESCAKATEEHRMLVRAPTNLRNEMLSDFREHIRREREKVYSAKLQTLPRASLTPRPALMTPRDKGASTRKIPMGIGDRRVRAGKQTTELKDLPAEAGRCNPPAATTSKMNMKAQTPTQNVSLTPRPMTTTSHCHQAPRSRKLLIEGDKYNPSPFTTPTTARPLMILTLAEATLPITQQTQCVKPRVDANGLDPLPEKETALTMCRAGQLANLDQLDAVDISIERCSSDASLKHRVMGPNIREPTPRLSNGQVVPLI